MQIGVANLCSFTCSLSKMFISIWKKTKKPTKFLNTCLRYSYFDTFAGQIIMIFRLNYMSQLRAAHSYAHATWAKKNSPNASWVCLVKYLLPQMVSVNCGLKANFSYFQCYFSSWLGDLPFVLFSLFLALLCMTMCHCSKQLITAVTLQTFWNHEVLMCQQIRSAFNLVHSRLLFWKDWKTL